MSKLHHKVHLEMNYSWKNFFGQSIEELKATDENRNAPKNMSYCFLFDIAERYICEICTVTSSFFDNTIF